MAKNRRKNIVPSPQANQTLPTPITAGQASLVVNQIQFRTVDLTPKDIADFRKSLEAAISVYNPNRTRLYDLLTNILIDTHLSGILSKRWDSVLNKVITFQVKDKKVEDLDRLIKKKKFRDLVKGILESQSHGVTGYEFIPGPEFDYKIIPRKHIKQKWGLIADEQNGQTGFNYLDAPNFWIVGEPDDIGFLIKCAPLALWKRGTMGDWSQYIEIFGQPIRVAKYDAHDTQTKQELERALNDSGGSLAIMIPNQATLEIMDGKMSNGDGKLQDGFRNALNAEMSVCVLGNTETTTNGQTGTGAKSNVHQEQQLEITKSDLAYVLNYLNSPEFLYILSTYGYNVEGGEFIFSQDVDMELIAAKVNVAATVKKMGIPIDDNYIYEITGIPKPPDYEAQKAKQELTAATLEDDPEETDPPAPKPKKKKPGKAPANLYDYPKKKTFIHTLRTALADFFDPPR